MYIGEKMNVVFVDLVRCLGCGHCEWICSVQRTGDCRPEDSSIWVKIDPERMAIFTTTCFQCETAYCLEVCPTKALRRDPQTNAVVVAEDCCSGCKLCIEACPFGNMHFDSKKGVAAKCDVCHGDPKCVKFCMAKALHYGDINELAEMKRPS
jgi:Fe-S-cluster-containing dehydrogenase component